MNLKSILFIVLCGIQPAMFFAQIGTGSQQKAPSLQEFKKLNMLKTWVTTKDGKRSKGYLYRLTDDELILLPLSSSYYYSFVEDLQQNQQKMPFSDVQVVRTKIDKSIGRGMLIGTGVGVLGALIFAGTQQGGFNHEYAGIGILFMGGIALSGTFMGAIFSKKKRKYALNDYEELKALKEKGIWNALAN